MWNTCSNYLNIFRVVVLMTVLAKFSVHGFNYFQRQASSYREYAEELIQDSRPVTSHGSWKEYGPWSSCSRTCGPGIQERNRTCYHRIRHEILPDEDCIGEPKQIKVCKLQDCPSGVYSDFRQQECDQISTSEKIWKPLYYPDDPALNPCWLSCYSNQATAWKIVNHEVPDGTHCVIKSGPGVCIDNECKIYGCDGLVGSSKVKDVCGICDGDGSSCNVVTSTKIVNHLQVGYNEALEIPSGATNIRILELYGGKNYLALCDQDGTYIFNGNYRIENSRIFVVSGNLCSYQRRESVEHDAGVSHREMFTCKGPFNETITVMVLTRDRSPSYLAFEYTLPLEPATISTSTSSNTIQTTTTPTTVSPTTASPTTVSSTTSATVSPSSTTPSVLSSTTVSSTNSSVVSSKPGTSSIVSPATSTVSPTTSATLSPTTSTIVSPKAGSVTTPSLDTLPYTSHGASSADQEDFMTSDDRSKQDQVLSSTSHQTTPFRKLSNETKFSGHLKLPVNDSNGEVSSGRVAISAAGVRVGTEETNIDPGDATSQRSHILHSDDGEGIATSYVGISSSSGSLSDVNRKLPVEENGLVTPNITDAVSGPLQTSNPKNEENNSSKDIPQVGILGPTVEPVSSKQDSTHLNDGTVISSSSKRPQSDSFSGVTDPKNTFLARTRSLPSLKNRLTTAPTRKEGSPSMTYETGVLEYPSYSFDGSFELAYSSKNYFEWDREEFINDRQTSGPLDGEFALNVTPPPDISRDGDAPSTSGTLLQGTVPSSVLSVTSAMVYEPHSSPEMAKLPEKEKNNHNDPISWNKTRTSLAPSVDGLEGEREEILRGEVTAEDEPPQLPGVVPELTFEEPEQKEYVHVTLGIHFAELVDPRLSNITVGNQISSKAGNSSQGRLNINLVDSNQIPDFQPPVSNPPSHHSETTPPVKGTTERQSTNVRAVSSATMSPKNEVEMSRTAASTELTTPGHTSTVLAEKVETSTTTTDRSTTSRNTKEMSTTSRDTKEMSTESTTSKTTTPKSTTTVATTTKVITTTAVTSQAVTTTTPVAITTTPITTTVAMTTTSVPITTQSNEIAPIPDYVWRVTAYSPCSATCRRGLQTEYAFCVNRREETVPDNMCYQETKPEIIPRSCEGQGCEPRWVIGAWSSCSVTCGGGLKFRTVSCWRMESRGIDVWKPNAYCNATEPAASSHVCGSVECVLRWQVGEWSRCSAECGEGQQTRVVLCSVTDTSKGYCDPDSRPSDTQRCEGTRCQSSWGTSPWAECRGNCQLQTRRVNCYSPSGSRQPVESLCYSQPKPLSDRICGSGICAAQWIPQTWNQDNCRDCRRAYRTRTVSCQSVSAGRTVELSDDYCSHLSVPPKTSACSCSRNSPSQRRPSPSSQRHQSPPRWYTTRWSECSVTCGGGQKNRKVKCYEGRVPSSRCDRSFMPPATQTCNTEECIVCTDNPQVKCNVIRQAGLCKYKYYSDNCCRTCTQGK